ncbi:GspH/FimT family pseudopilin [Pseudomonas sp. UMAB-08]|uniref:GspH/FimT family pseudopilin n=1 Tax=Pseudomonas sp. UMAB-08 TaxID=1365375 RepID=UPI001C5A4740|nr:GspH/FimT family pseudopilin [Pseudomonas sp. UMAB-08]
MRHRSKGFSLIELLVTVSVVGILAAIAVPNFQSSIQNSKADSEVSDLQRALNYARMEAINRGVSTRITPSTGTAWNTQLQIVLVSSPTVPLRVVSAMSGGATVTVSPESIAAIAAIDFNSLGGLAAPAVSLVMTYALGNITQTVSACLNGRIVLGGSC